MSEDNRPKSLQSLIRHIKNDHDIEISGKKQKTLLKHYGYYHGYKGYRFFNNTSNQIKFTDFNQVISVIKYDSQLKALFYPRLMFIETALKNIVIDKIVKGLKTPSFDSVYAARMCDNIDNTKLRIARLKLKDKVHSTLSNRYGKHNTMVSHYYDRGDEVPIWAIFEIISLGDFAELIYCLNNDVRISVQEDLGLKTGSDTGNQLLSNIVFTLKSLRNAVAHNNVVFDTRFKDREPNKNVLAWIHMELNISDINFKDIVDYVILICCILKKIECDNEMICKFVDEFRLIIDTAYKELSSEIYMKIIPTNTRNKLESLSEYISH